MQNKKFKFAAILSTILLALSVLVTSVSAVTPNGGQQASSATFVGTKSSSSQLSYTVSASSESLKPVASAGSNVDSSNTLSVNADSNNNGSVVDDNSGSEGWEGQNHVIMKTHYVSPNDIDPYTGENLQEEMEDEGIEIGQGLYPHFNVNDDIGKCYCYDWQLTAPDKPDPGLTYNRYDFWDGMKAAANKQQEDQVAAAMMGGYHLNKDDNQWEVSPAFRQVAEEGYQEAMKDYKNGDYTPDPWFTNNSSDSSTSSASSASNASSASKAKILDEAGALEVAQNVGPNYTLQDYERDVTQSVIWKLGGAKGQDESLCDLANKTEFGRELYDYAVQHPLNEETAKADKVSITSSGKKVSQSNPLVISPDTLRSQVFTFSGYDGNVSLLNKDPNIEVIDSRTNTPTTVLSQGHSYYLKAKTEAAANSIHDLDLQFQKIDESHYFSVVDADAQDWNDINNINNKYQNMVNLATKALTLPVNYVFVQKQSSSSLSVSSISESNLSSKISSVSSIGASLSSKKSLSVVSNNQSSLSSKKSSSSVASSSKSSLSSVKNSSSVASSSKASSKKSSSVISSPAISSSVENQTVESSVFTQSHHRHHHKHHKFSEESSVVLSKSAKTTVVSSSEQSAQVVSSSAQNTKVSSQSQKKAQNESSKKQAVVAGNKNNSQHGVSSNQHGKGEGHGMPQTGEAATALVAVGVVLLATAGVVELRKNK